MCPLPTELLKLDETSEMLYSNLLFQTGSALKLEPVAHTLSSLALKVFKEGDYKDFLVNHLQC